MRAGLPSALASVPVYVAVYEFPPYYSSRVTKHITGLLVTALNEHQSDYQFILREVRAAERYHAVSEGGCCDVIFFESEMWGWAASDEYQWGLGLTASAERFYVMREALEAGRVSFNSVEANRIGGVHGYNYTFTGNITDPAELEERFRLYTTNNPMSVLQMLVGSRVEMAILNDDFVAWARHLGFSGAEDIEGSDFADHDFTTQVVVKAKGQVSVDYINRQLKALKETGVLQGILSEFGIAHLMFEED